MSLPPEFFTKEELQELIGTPQIKRQLEWLRSNHVPHLVSVGGRPLVYRDRLLPSHMQAKAGAAAEADDEPDFDFSAARPRHSRAARA